MYGFLLQRLEKTFLISHDGEKENPDSADDDEEDKRTQHQSRQQRAK